MCRVRVVGLELLEGTAMSDRSAEAAEQQVMILQVPSEANAERLMNVRIREANDDGWTVAAMQDHNGFLVLLLKRVARGES